MIANADEHFNSYFSICPLNVNKQYCVATQFSEFKIHKIYPTFICNDILYNFFFILKNMKYLYSYE